MHFPFEACSSAQRAHWSVEVTLGSSSALVGSFRIGANFQYRLTIDCIMIMVSNSILGNELRKISRLKFKMAYDASWFFFAVSSYFSLYIIVDWLFRGFVERPGHRENEHVIEADATLCFDGRRRKRPISATTTTREPTKMQITASVSVWAIGCPFFAMKKAIRPPGRRRSFSLRFLQ